MPEATPTCHQTFGEGKLRKLNSEMHQTFGEGKNMALLCLSDAGGITRPAPFSIPSPSPLIPQSPLAVEPSIEASWAPR